MGQYSGIPVLNFHESPIDPGLYGENTEGGMGSPPPGEVFWITNVGNFIVTNTGVFLVFNPG